MTDWNKSKVVDLRLELKNRGLLQTGLKPALVARLTAADNEDGTESEATVQGESLKLDASAAPSPDTVSPTQPQNTEALPEQQPISHPAPNEPAAAPEGEHVDTAMEEAPAEPLSILSANTVEFSQATSQPEPERSALPSVDPEEVIEDRQKRKRRSQTPPVSSADVARKRARKSDEVEAGNDELHTSQSDAVGIEKNNGVDQAGIEPYFPADVDFEEDPPEMRQEMEVDTKLEDTHESKATDGSPSTARDSRFKDLFNSPQAGPAARMEIPESRDLAHEEAEPERNIPPAIHPATAALYIRDFMRPLNPQQLKAYISELATPPGQDIVADVIVDFHLDPIRTHAFISFTNVSAASRVRSALHDRIWPNERTRKPLWVDFVPSDVVKGWIEVEESQNPGGRGSGKKWEVIYDVNDDRQVTASLQEASNIPMSNNPRKPSTQLAPQALPFQPPSPVARRGIEGAPSGPRSANIQEPLRAQVAAINTETLDHLFKSTTAKPSLYWLPVPKEIANKRLDALEDGTSKRYSRSDRPDEKINRFTFQDGHVLVDRGPELFGGIRPPQGFRGPSFGPTRAPMRRGGFGGRGTYDSYRGGGGDRRGSRDDRRY